MENNDRYIDNLYSAKGITRWDATKPATARLLSVPAINYTQMVINHDQRMVGFYNAQNEKIRINIGPLAF